MRSRLVLADIARWIARVSAVPAILLILFYVLFGVGYGIAEGVSFWILLSYAVPLLAALPGLILGYSNERKGSIIGFVSVLALFALIWAFAGLEDVLDEIYWAILLVPFGLFFASWWLRRTSL